MLQPIPFVVVTYKDPAEKLFKSLDASSYPTAQMQWDNTDDNRYVAYGWNRAILSAMADSKYDMVNHILTYTHPYIIVATQDVELEKNCVLNLVKFMDENPRCAIAGVKQIRSDMETIYHAGGANSMTLGRNDIGQEVIGGGSHYCGFVSAGHHAESKQRPWVNGSLMIMRLAAIQEFGLFDENMRLCCIDSDICYAARARGWEVWYCADAVVIHDAGISSGEAKPETMQIMREDMLFFKHKWAGSSMYMKLALEHNDAYRAESFKTVAPDVAAMMKARGESPMMASPKQTLEYLDKSASVKHAGAAASAEDALSQPSA